MIKMNTYKNLLRFNLMTHNFLHIFPSSFETKRFINVCNRQYKFDHGKTINELSHQENSKVEIIYKNIDKSKYNVLENHFKIHQTHLSEEDSFSEKIDLILKEYEYFKYFKGHVPSDISVENMKDLLTINSEKHRQQFLRYLFLTESRKLKDKLKKFKKKQKYQSFISERKERNFGIFNENGELTYQLWGNTLLTRINSRCVSHYQLERKLRHASLFGQKLVIDLDYDDFMTLNDCRIQVRHIVNTLVQNVNYSEPYDLYFANCDYKKPTMQSLSKYFNMNPLMKMDLKSHFRSESYLDFLPKERLVYLSPNASKSLETYNHDDIYIIGGFLDKSCLNRPISHLKAKKEGIRQYRLPLDEYLSWGSGSSKHLCIMHMIDILDSLKNSNSWITALKENIPKRKMKDENVTFTQDEQRRIAFIRRKLSMERENSFDLRNFQDLV